MRKHSLIACLAIVGLCSSAFAALPAAASKHLKKAALAPEAPQSSVEVQAAGPCGQPCSYFEDFDDAVDFVAGTWIGNGLNGAAGGAFETWSATCTSNPANWPGNVVGTPAEGHVETANPFSGTQHVRISKDPNMLTSPFGCVTDARVPATAAVAPVPVSPQTVSAQLAINATFGANFQMQPQQPTEGVRTTTLLLFYYGTQYVIDNPGGGAVFTFAGTWDTTGAYNNYFMHIDPCAKFSCNGGPNDGQPCASSTDCPDTLDCRGFIEYGDNSGVFYTGQAWAGLSFEQILFYSDNTGNPAVSLDIDDVAIERDPNPCPVVCGDGDLGPGEQCEDNPLLDAACPGRCVPAGGTGDSGEGECQCNTGPCAETTNDLPNGDNQSFVDHFGWWTFTADAPAYGISACGTADYDSALAVWVGTCDNLSLAPGNHSAGIAYNDDCYGGPNFGDGSDPLASCYNGASALLYPYNSCLCLSTTEGTQYWVWDPRVSFGDETILNVEKRLACDSQEAFGACCDPFVGCQDVASAGSCDPRGSFTDSKTCAGVGDQCPEPFLGACCDRLTGACSETTETACGGNSTFSLGTRCGSGVCQPDKGACCVATPFEADCTVTKGVDCVDDDPSDNVFVSFSPGSDCAEVACGPEVIPTVSEWGLVIMALLLLVGAKVYFGRREALA